MEGRYIVYQIFNFIHLGVFSCEGADYCDKFRIEFPVKTPVKEIIKKGDYQARSRLMKEKYRNSSLREGHARRSKLVIKTEKGREIYSHLTETGRNSK